MSDILINNKTGETRWPASFNSLLNFSGVSMQKTSVRPVTAGDYTLYTPVKTTRPAGDVVREIKPILTDGIWTQQWSSRGFTADELKSLRDEAKRDIDRQAEAQRMKYMTPGEGKATVYQEKIKEAAQYRLDGIPEAAVYPAGADNLIDGNALKDIVSERYTLLASTIGIDGQNLEEVVQVVEAMKSQWKAIAANIERKCKLAQKAVDHASSALDIDKAKIVDWQ